MKIYVARIKSVFYRRLWQRNTHTHTHTHTHTGSVRYARHSRGMCGNARTWRGIVRTIYSVGRKNALYTRIARTDFDCLARKKNPPVARCATKVVCGFKHMQIRACADYACVCKSRQCWTLQKILNLKHLYTSNRLNLKGSDILPIDWKKNQIYLPFCKRIREEGIRLQ